MAGYHISDIKKGKLGKFSKIKEEFLELEDAYEQQANIMILCELSDLYGAIEFYINEKFGMNMNDIAKMNELTKKAFKDGTRK